MIGGPVLISGVDSVLIDENVVVPTEVLWFPIVVAPVSVIAVCSDVVTVLVISGDVDLDVVDSEWEVVGWVVVVNTVGTSVLIAVRPEVTADVELVAKVLVD